VSQDDVADAHRRRPVDQRAVVLSCPAVVEQILADLRTPTLRQSARIEDAYGTTVGGLIGIVVAQQQAIDQLQTALGQEFDTHPQAAILRSVPGLDSRCS
jgi:hypothetical protein